MAKCGKHKNRTAANLLCRNEFRADQLWCGRCKLPSLEDRTDRTKVRRKPPGTTQPWSSACGPRRWVVAVVLALLAAVTAPVTSVAAVEITTPDVRVQSDSDHEDCVGDDDPPTPTAVTVSTVPIVVTSTAADYFVLYARFGSGDTASELPVSVVRGQAGTTTLEESVEALPAARYRVEKYSVAAPGDVDGDCVDDLTELDDVSMSPVNFAVPEFADGTALTTADGTVIISDRAAFETLAEFRNRVHTVKFVILGMDTDTPALYFMNTNRHQYHYGFTQTIDALSRTALNATLVFDSSLTAPDGGTGTYYFFLDAYYLDPSVTDFEVLERSYALLAANMAFLDDDLILYITNGLLPAYQTALAELRESRIDLAFTEDIYGNAEFVALHQGTSYGYLRTMDPNERPGPRDVVLYDTLPNELPRVAGIISTVPQTPLSHVNLRAIQDDVPNAYIRDIPDDADIAALVNRPIAYTVTSSTWNVSAATVEEVDAHHAALRPADPQTPERDMTVTAITPLCRVGFADWDAFGVKAANVAVLGRLGFVTGTVPDGFAIPFYFYDEFMKANDLYSKVDEMVAVANFATDLDVQEAELKKLRKAIKNADTPEWITTELTKMHNAFPAGTTLRYRSSTNNEDLPGFNGAGLYDSKTQHLDETPLSKSLRQVFASMWSYRAFAEREFYRVDHKAAAMGVLVHPNYSDELANGVAVSFDPFDGTDPQYGDGPYYLNTQVGEDLVTNPDAHSVPEEIRLKANGIYDVMALSNQVERGELLLSDAQMRQLRGNLETIHNRFGQLYGVASYDPFAMEIEFKITADNVLTIKQARPWVFTDATPSTLQPQTEDLTGACTTDRLTALGSDTPITIPDAPRSPAVRRSTSISTSGGGGGGGDLDVGTAVVVLANGWSPADVGVASVMAARSESAVVAYTVGDELSDPARELIRDASPAELIIVGGITAVSRDVRVAVRSASPETNTERVTGADRADTAAQAARRILGSPGDVSGVTLVIANGWSPPDIGAAAALAASTRRSAVLYTQAGKLPDAAAALLSEYRPSQVVLIGGTAAISAEVEAGIAAAAPEASVQRVTGTDRIDTAAQTARRILGNPAGAPDGVTLVIASGWSPPDIGVAAALATSIGNSAVLYVEPNRLAPTTAGLLGEYRVSQVILIGGTTAVSGKVRAAIGEIAPTAAVRRIAGSTRTHTAAAAARRILRDS